MADFIIPSKNEDLLKSVSGQFSVEEVFSTRLIPVKLQGTGNFMLLLNCVFDCIIFDLTEIFKLIVYFRGGQSTARETILCGPRAFTCLQKYELVS